MFSIISFILIIQKKKKNDNVLVVKICFKIMIVYWRGLYETDELKFKVHISLQLFVCFVESHSFNWNTHKCM